MAFLLDAAKSVFGINAAGGVENGLGPESDLAVAGMAGEADAFGDQAAADAEPARGRLDQEEPQLADGGHLANQDNAADNRTVLLGDPAALAFDVETVDEARGDFGDLGFEALVPSLFLGVQDAVAMDDPTDVAGLMSADQVRGLGVGRLMVEESFDSPHGCDQRGAFGWGELGDHGVNLALCTAVVVKAARPWRVRDRRVLRASWSSRVRAIRRSFSNLT